MENNSSREQLEQKLTQRKVKPTAMRLLVLRYLLAQTTAVSLPQLEKDFEKADRITLYRTLKTFETQKLIHRIEDGTNAPKFALCHEDCACNLEDLHVHFHCKDCEETYCITQTKVPKVSLPTNFKADQVNMVIKGKCGNCSTT